MTMTLVQLATWLDIPLAEKEIKAVLTDEGGNAYGLYQFLLQLARKVHSMEMEISEVVQVMGKPVSGP